MYLVGMMMARNERWCIKVTLRAALAWCDHIVFLDHNSTDATASIAVEMAAGEFYGRITVVQEPAARWDEMKLRQAMLELGRAIGGTHFAIIDADELITANIAGRIRHHIDNWPMKAGGMLYLPGFNLRGGLAQFHLSGVWGRRWFAVAFADQPGIGWSGNRYHHREPMGVVWRPYRPFDQTHGGVMHLWGASELRLRAKHALYKLTDPERATKGLHVIDARYSLAIHGSPGDTPSNWTFAPVPSEWLEGYNLNDIDLADEPWQIAECRRLISENPKIAEGLDLFGIV